MRNDPQLMRQIRNVFAQKLGPQGTQAMAVPPLPKKPPPVIPFPGSAKPLKWPGPK